MTATTTKQPDSKSLKIQTPEFRVSFPQVFEAKAVNPGDKAKFSVQMIFRVKETEASKKRGEPVVNIDVLRQTVARFLTEKFGPKEKWPRKPDGTYAFRLPFRSGAEKADKEGYDDGVIFASATSLQRPGLIDGQKNYITVPSDFYGGCYARATINPFWYDQKGNKGVGLGLQNIQKIRDGEPFSGKGKPEEDFDAIALPDGAFPAGVRSMPVDPMEL